MIDVRQNMNTLNKCYLEFGGTDGTENTTDLFSINLTMSVGQFPTCTVTISEASDAFPSVNNYCHVKLTIDDEDYTLFNGYIMAEAQTVSTSVSHVAGYRQYSIAILTEGVDSIPPTAWTYLTNAVNAEHGAVQGYTLVGNNIAGGNTKAKQRLAGNPNIAEVILKTMDALQSATVGSSGGSAISRLFTYDNTPLNMSGINDIPVYVADKATNLIKGGASYIQAIQTLCDEFFLTLIPYQEGSWYKMHIAYKPAWGPSISKKITLSDYIGILMSNSSIKNRKIDGVIMPYWDTTGGNITHLGQYAFYGRIRMESGLDFVITSHKDLANYLGNTTSGLRYKQIPTPAWLGKGLSTSSLQRAVRGLVKSYFSLYSYAQRKITLDIPIINFFSYRDKLGDLVSVEAFSNSLEGLDKGVNNNPLLKNMSSFLSGNPKTKTYIGQLMSISLNINFVQSKLMANCSVSISHVRSERTNKILNFTPSELMYK
jgi:hypothetical protein